jgi:DNA-binding transcriptional MerR regulator
MVAEELLIHELAERAGISVRTIRYYIEEGLLPQPSYQGKYSYYTPAYLDRLELIRRLKDSYLPLREIREIMSSLTDEQVHLKLKESPPPAPQFSAQPMPAQPVAKPGEKALNYISQVMEDQTKFKSKGSFDKDQISVNHQKESHNQPWLSVPESSPLPDGELWQRISLAPGVELHVHRPLAPQIENRLRQLISYARRLFNSKS